MRRGLARAVAVLYILLLPVASMGHAELVGGHSALTISPHDHGPHAPCPPAKDTHCLACAVSLVSPPPSVQLLAPPEVRRAEWSRARAFDSAPVLPGRTGRSPPSSTAI